MNCILVKVLHCNWWWRRKNLTFCYFRIVGDTFIVLSLSFFVCFFSFSPSCTLSPILTLKHTKFILSVQSLTEKMNLFFSSSIITVSQLFGELWCESTIVWLKTRQLGSMILLVEHRSSRSRNVLLGILSHWMLNNLSENKSHIRIWNYFISL